MSLSTYSDLQTSIANYLARSDLTSIIPDFITLAENRLRRELRIRHLPKVKKIFEKYGDQVKDWIFRKDLEARYGKESKWL